jgi:hypothetical protein
MADPILPTACDFRGKCRDLLHAANLWHGTDGFTSPPKEGMLRNFCPKNPKASAGFEPANLGTRGQHANVLNHLFTSSLLIDSSWNVMAHGDAREGKWRGNWRMELVSSTLHTTSEHGVSSITITDAHTSDASILLNCRPPSIYMDSPVSLKDEIWFLRVCHHISTGL